MTKRRRRMSADLRPSQTSIEKWLARLDAAHRALDRFHAATDPVERLRRLRRFMRLSGVS
jgi:hypothetical protein